MLFFGIYEGLQSDTTSQFSSTIYSHCHTVYKSHSRGIYADDALPILTPSTTDTKKKRKQQHREKEKEIEEKSQIRLRWEEIGYNRPGPDRENMRSNLNNVYRTVTQCIWLIWRNVSK